jgi:hypothetical protein
MLPQAQELLERSASNKITKEDIEKPPGAKPRLSSTTPNVVVVGNEKTPPRPATVHVSDVHKHLRRAHQV